MKRHGDSLRKGKEAKELGITMTMAGARINDWSKRRPKCSRQRAGQGRPTQAESSSSLRFIKAVPNYGGVKG